VRSSLLHGEGSGGDGGHGRLTLVLQVLANLDGHGRLSSVNAPFAFELREEQRPIVVRDDGDFLAGLLSCSQDAQVHRRLSPPDANADASAWPLACD